MDFPGPSLNREDADAQSWLEGGFGTYAIGLLAAAGIAAYGIVALHRGQVAYGARINWTFGGASARAMGIGAIASALFLHCRYFWENRIGQHWISELGKIIGLAGFIGAAGFLLVRNGVLGLQ